MDFKRIGWIFFFAFLGVNIFLFNIYQEADSEQDVVYRSDQKIPIEKRLDSENISYTNNFSKEALQGYYLSGTPTNLQNAVVKEREQLADPDFLKSQTTIKDSKLTHELAETVAFTDTKEAKNVVKKFLTTSDELIFGDDYTYMSKWSNWTDEYPRIFAAQTYEGIPINDDSSLLTVNMTQDTQGYQLLNYTQTHISDLTPLREAMTLYTEEDAINTLYVNNKIPAKSTIKWQQLAYTLTLKVRGQYVYVPAWFVAIVTDDNSLQIEQVNALTNRVITNSTVQTVENP